MCFWAILRAECGHRISLDVHCDDFNSATRCRKPRKEHIVYRYWGAIPCFRCVEMRWTPLLEEHIPAQAALGLSRLAHMARTERVTPAQAVAFRMRIRAETAMTEARVTAARTRARDRFDAATRLVRADATARCAADRGLWRLAVNCAKDLHRMRVRRKRALPEEENEEPWTDWGRYTGLDEEEDWGWDEGEDDEDDYDGFDDDDDEEEEDDDYLGDQSGEGDDYGDEYEDDEYGDEYEEDDDDSHGSEEDEEQDEQDEQDEDEYEDEDKGVVGWRNGAR